MTRYILSPRAQDDLDAIWDYTADRWSIDQADRYVCEIRQACLELAFGHKRGRSAEALRPGYFRLEVGSHVLFYRLVDDDVVDIIRILHQRMNLPSRLRD
jgi:toxin ParE1/3/4